MNDSKQKDLADLILHQSMRRLREMMAPYTICIDGVVYDYDPNMDEAVKLWSKADTQRIDEVLEWLDAINANYSILWNREKYEKANV